MYPLVLLTLVRDFSPPCANQQSFFVVYGKYRLRAFYQSTRVFLHHAVLGVPLHPGDDPLHRLRHPHRRPRGVALQVAFERQTLKPVFQLIGVRLWF
jgi:hypothetical protein